MIDRRRYDRPVTLEQLEFRARLWAVAIWTSRGVLVGILLVAAGYLLVRVLGGLR